jgi:hypothetical protein
LESVSAGATNPQIKSRRINARAKTGNVNSSDRHKQFANRNSGCREHTESSLISCARGTSRYIAE